MQPKQLEVLAGMNVADVAAATLIAVPDCDGRHSIYERVTLVNGRRFFRDEDGDLRELEPCPGTHAHVRLVRDDPQELEYRRAVGALHAAALSVVDEGEGEDRVRDLLTACREYHAAIHAKPSAR